MQIIRYGSGINHAEKVKPGNRIFQIRFDPNLQQSLGKPATYDNYRAGSFPDAEKNGMKTTTIMGADAPIALDSPFQARRF